MWCILHNPLNSIVGIALGNGKLNRLLLKTRFVNRRNKLDGHTAAFSGNKRSAARFDGCKHILNLAFMCLMGELRKCAVELVKLLLQFLILLGEPILERGGGMHLPRSRNPRIFTLEDELLFLTMMNDRAGHLGNCTFLILQRRYGNILDLRVVMCGIA
ncbi:hypothetical protein D3C81_1833900 [compost metagenome]